MTSTSPCGRPDCPVVALTPHLLNAIRPVVLPAGTRWWRGTTYPAADLVPGAGDTRFAPLANTAHAYFGGTKTVALLESALHDAAGTQPIIYLSQMRSWAVHELELTQPLRLADLRNPELERMSLTRSQLVNTTAAHYTCTRRWAAELQGGVHGLDGIIWHSRQADLYAQIHPHSLLADVVVVRVCGFGAASYELALRGLVEHLRSL